MLRNPIGNVNTFNREPVTKSFDEWVKAIEQEADAEQAAADAAKQSKQGKK